MNFNILTIGLLVTFVSGTFLLASAADVPFYQQDVRLEQISAGILVLGLFMLVLGFVSSEKATEHHL